MSHLLTTSNALRHDQHLAQALTRKFSLAPGVDLMAVAEACQASLTGADLYALCADAWMAALQRLPPQSEVSAFFIKYHVGR